MMVIELVEGDESRVRWNYGEGWHYADIDDLIRAYESVRHGHWIEAKYPLFTCSECGAIYQDVGYGYNYCPNCGAKMDGERKEDETD